MNKPRCLRGCRSVVWFAALFCVSIILAPFVLRGTCESRKDNQDQGLPQSTTIDTAIEQICNSGAHEGATCGTAEDDVIVGNDDNNIIYDGDGNDLIYAYYESAFIDRYTVAEDLLQTSCLAVMAMMAFTPADARH